MAPIAIIKPPSSPSLIDLAPQQPKPTLLDDVDYTLFLPDPLIRKERAPNTHVQGVLRPPHFQQAPASLPPHLRPYGYAHPHPSGGRNDRLIDAPTPAKTRPVAPPGIGNDPRLDRQVQQQQHCPATVSRQPQQDAFDRQRLIDARPFVPHLDRQPHCAAYGPPRAATKQLNSQQRAWDDRGHANAHENSYEPNDQRLNYSEADAVRQAISAGAYGLRRGPPQLPQGTQHLESPYPETQLPAQRLGPAVPELVRPPAQPNRLRPTAEEYKPAAPLWSNQAPWNRDPGVPFAALPPSKPEASRARAQIPPVADTAVSTSADLRFTLEPEPHAPVPHHWAGTSSEGQEPVKQDLGKVLAALKSVPVPAEVVHSQPYEQLLSALRRLALEPPISAPLSAADKTGATAQVSSSDNSEGGPVLGKKARKRERARQAKAQEEEERDLVVRTLLQTGHPSNSTVQASSYSAPVESYNFDYPSLYPSNLESSALNPLTLPFHPNYTAPDRRAYQPDLESPPDTLPLSRSDHSIGDLAAEDSLPVEVDDSEPFESDLVGQPGTGNFAEDKAIILNTEEELFPWFKSDIVAIPYPKIDIPQAQANQEVKVPKAIKTATVAIPKPAVETSAVAKTSEAVTGGSAEDLQKSLEGLSTEERLERVLAYLGINPTSGALTVDQADRHVASVLDKYSSAPHGIKAPIPQLQVSVKPPATTASTVTLAQPQPFRPSALSPAFSVLNVAGSRIEPQPNYDHTRYDSYGLSRSNTQDSIISDQLYTPEWAHNGLPETYQGLDREFEQYFNMSAGQVEAVYGAEASKAGSGLQLNNGQSSRNTGPNAARLRWGKANHNEDMQLAEIADAPINADADYLDDLDDLLNVISISGRDRHAALRPIAEPHARHTSSARSFVVSENDIAPYDLLLALPPARRNVPASLRSNPDDSLQSGIMNAWMAAEPPEVQKLAIAALTDRLTRLINRHFGGTSNGSGKERFKVDVFGSVSWDGNTGNGGDLDMVIRDRKFPQGYRPDLWPATGSQSTSRNDARRYRPPPANLSAVHDIRQLVIILRQNGYRDVQGIPAATTPIVKFRDAAGDFDCDINVNDLGGWYNSKLILAYCEISPFVLRPLIHVLKCWVKANHVNDPSGSKGPASMSSYCLTLMAIGYLQHLGALPNLQEDVDVRRPEHPEDLAEDVVWGGYGKDQGMKIHVGFSDSPPPGWTPRDPSLTAAKAVRGFFDFFTPNEHKRYSSSPPFDYVNQMVSIANGGVIKRALPLGGMQAQVQTRRAQGLPEPSRADREANMGKGMDGIQPNNWGERRLVVQDPFIWQKNCTQAMSKAGLDRWLSAVRKSSTTLSTLGNRCTYDNFALSRLLEPEYVRPMAGRGRIPSPGPALGMGHMNFVNRTPSPGMGMGYGRGGGQGQGMGMGRASPGRGGGGMSYRPPVGNGSLWRG